CPRPVLPGRRRRLRGEGRRQAGRSIKLGSTPSVRLRRARVGLAPTARGLPRVAARPHLADGHLPARPAVVRRATASGDDWRRPSLGGRSPRRRCRADTAPLELALLPRLEARSGGRLGPAPPEVSY